MFIDLYKLTTDEVDIKIDMENNSVFEHKFTIKFTTKFGEKFATLSLTEHQAVELCDKLGFAIQDFADLKEEGK